MLFFFDNMKLLMDCAADRVDASIGRVFFYYFTTTFIGRFSRPVLIDFEAGPAPFAHRGPAAIVTGFFFVLFTEFSLFDSIFLNCGSKCSGWKGGVKKNESCFFLLGRNNWNVSLLFLPFVPLFCFFWVGSFVFCRLTDPKKATELFFVSFFWVFVVFLGGGGEMGSTDAMG